MSLVGRPVAQRQVWSSPIVIVEPPAISSSAAPPVSNAFRNTHSYLSERHSRSMKTLSIQRPRPSIEIRTSASPERRRECEAGELGGIQAVVATLDGSCDEHSKTALGSFWAGALVLTRSTAGGKARGAAAILGSDCGRHGE